MAFHALELRITLQSSLCVVKKKFYTKRTLREDIEKLI